MDYTKLTSVYEELEKTSKRLEKTYTLAKLLEDTSIEDLQYVIYLIQGRVFPKFDEHELGVSSRLMLKTISISTGSSDKEVEKLWVKEGDLGLVAEQLISKKKQTTLVRKKLTVKKVFENLRNLVEFTGEGTVSKKIGLISELLTSSSPKEAKFITRTVIGQLRVGVAEGTLRDAIAWAFFPKVIGIFFRCEKCKRLMPKSEKCLSCGNQLDPKFNEEIKKNFKDCLKINSINELKEKLDYDCIIVDNEKLAREIYNFLNKKIQDLYNLTNDFASVALSLKKKETIKVEIKPGNPVNPMLAIRIDTINEAFDALGKPVLCDYKLDGMRLQIHKDKNKFWFFTRRLDNVTKQFNELVKIVKDNVKADSFIIDSEVVGYDPKTYKYSPFQSISQRIKRKYDIEKIAKEIPVEINVFDIIYKNNKNLMNSTQKERREILEKTVHEIKYKIVLTKKIIANNEKEINDFYKESLKKGNEGIMIKNLNKEYAPGRKVGGWLKFKPNLEPLDLVIVGATYGEGKRANVLSSFILACKDDGKFLECGMMGSGIKEKSEQGTSFEELTKLLKPLMIKKEAHAVKVKPEIVVEVIYEEIQKSPTYNSGLALRFPRLSRLRIDKPVKEINTLDDIKKIYEKQRGRHKK